MPFLLIFGPIFGVCAFAVFVAHGHKTLALAAAAKNAGAPATQHFELDHGMPDVIAHRVLEALVHDQEPAHLQALAHELGTKYPLAASELYAKAAALGGSKGAGAESPPPSPSPSTSHPPPLPAGETTEAAHPSAAAGTPDLGDAALILQAAMKAYAEETDPVSLEGFAESIRAKYPTAAILLVGRAHEFRAATPPTIDAANAHHVPVVAGSPAPPAAEPPGGGVASTSAATAPPPVKLATYVVQAGDSPSAIAERFTHDGKRWPELVAANPGKPTAHDGSFASMRQGETLTLPSTWGSPPGSHVQPNVANAAHSTEAHP
jgi:nucleoid-associated protein YgaU